MSLFYDEDFYGADFVELPCEFCNVLFPSELLMEHQSGCRPDLLHFNYEDVAPVASISPQVSSKSVEFKQTTLDLPKAPNTSPVSKLTNITTQEKKNKEYKTSVADPFEELLKEDDDEIPIIFEDNSQESGVKLMSYGLNAVKRTEEEKPSFRPPPLPLFNDQNETNDICNTLSDADDDDDDNAGESLEDFWRRADIKNSQRLRKLKI